jgi:hypothetical protein
MELPETGAGPCFSLPSQHGASRGGGEIFWNESGMILKAVRALIVIKALTCTSL